MKTAELTGCELDQWVAKALGYEARALVPDELVGRHPAGSGFKVWSPSTDWEQGGPIIERERIQLMPWKVGSPDSRVERGMTMHFQKPDFRVESGS